MAAGSNAITKSDIQCEMPNEHCSRVIDGISEENIWGLDEHCFTRKAKKFWAHETAVVYYAFPFEFL